MSDIQCPTFVDCLHVQLKEENRREAEMVANVEREQRDELERARCDLQVEHEAYKEKASQLNSLRRELEEALKVAKKAQEGVERERREMLQGFQEVKIALEVRENYGAQCHAYDIYVPGARLWKYYYLLVTPVSGNRRSKGTRQVIHWGMYEVMANVRMMKLVSIAKLSEKIKILLQPMFLTEAIWFGWFSSSAGERNKIAAGERLPACCETSLGAGQGKGVRFPQ